MPELTSGNSPSKYNAGLESRERAGRSGFSFPAWAVLALPPVCAAVLGIARWLSVRSQPMAPDARTYLSYAADFGPASLLGGFREPAWIALMALSVRIFGEIPDAAMLVGVAGFVFMVAVFHQIARRAHPERWALAASLLLSVSPWLVYQSARGLREETSAALLSLFGLVAMGSGRDMKSAVGMALLSGLGAMLRWDTLLITLPLMALVFGARRLPLRYWVVSLVIVCAIVSPLVAGNWLKTGDPLYHSNFHARFFRNIEFRDKPGFPTSEELSVDRHAGALTTWGDYLFGLHSPGELARRTLSGIVRAPYITTYNSMFYSSTPLSPEDLTSFSTRYVRLAAAVLLVMAAVTGGVVLLFGSGWPLGVILFLSIAQFAPIAEIMDPRLALTTVPFMLLGILELGAALTGRRLKERVKMRKAVAATRLVIARGKRPFLGQTANVGREVD